jgi:pimeloyl-ACP methyl ester carboxylesterase
VPETTTDDLTRAAEDRLYAHYSLPHTERVVRAGDLDVRVVEINPDAAGTPVLLLHGIASVTAAAVPLVAHLGDRRVIALDWPGHGLSGPLVLKRDDDLRAIMVSVIDAVLDAYGLKRVDIVAHSLGGQFALYYVLARAARVRRLVLLGAPGAGFSEVTPVPAMRLLSIPGVGRGILSLPASPAAYAKNSAATLGPGALDGYPADLAEAGRLASQRPGFAPSVASYFRALITPFRVRANVPVSHAELATITVPTFMVWGDEDVFLTPDRGRASIESIPGAKLLVVKGGHAPWLNQLNETSAAVVGFLDAP